MYTSSKPAVTLTLLAALAFVRAAPLAEEANHVSDLHERTDEGVKLRADPWTAAYSLDKVEHEWHGMGNYGGSWSFKFDGKDYVKEHFNAYVFKPDAGKDFPSWKEFAPALKTKEDVETKAETKLECSITSEKGKTPHGGGDLILMSREPYLMLSNVVAEQGVKASCKKVDKA